MYWWMLSFSTEFSLMIWPVLFLVYMAVRGSMLVCFGGKERWAKLSHLLPFLWVQVTGQGTTRGGQRKTEVFCGLPKPSCRGCLAFWQFLSRNPEFQTQEQISHGSVPCGRQCEVVLNVQESMGFPTEAPSGDVAVTGVALFSYCANFLLSSEIFLAGKLTRSLFPYLECFHKSSI